VFSLAQARYIEADVPLNLIKYMKKEDDYLPWNTLINNRINFYIDMLDSTELYGDFKLLLIDLISGYYQRVGWIEDRSKEEPVDGFIRSSLIQLACRIGTPDCLLTAQSFFNEWMSSPGINLIPVEMKATAYCTGVNGVDGGFDFLLKKLQEDRKENVKADLLIGLSCARKAWQLEKFLNDRLDTSNDTMLALRDIITRSPSYAFAWSFVKNHWNELYSRYGKPNLNIINYLYVKDILNDLASKLNTEVSYNDVRLFKFCLTFLRRKLHMCKVLPKHI
jgi:hypothetical protein